MSFRAEISHFKTFYSVLRAILFKEHAVVRVMPTGLKFTLEEMRNVETSAYIRKEMFLSYHLDGPELTFKVSLKIFTECLNIFGDDCQPTIELSFEPDEGLLVILLKHNAENIKVNCEIRTMNVDNFNYISLADECNLNSVNINANILLELLQKLDNSADEIILIISPSHPYLQLESTGIAGESRVSISKHADCITSYQCQKESKAQYSYANIRQILKVMHFAKSVVLSTGDSGVLRLQLSILSEEKEIYVDYFVTPLFDP